MHKFLLATVAAATIASPGYAQDAGPYIGIEGGLLFPRDADFDLEVDGDETFGDVSLDYKRGWDFDVIGGFDFGAFRLEGELGHKRAKIEGVELDGEDFDDGNAGRVRVNSLMANALVDFDAGGLGAYAGGGFGRARVKFADGVGTDKAWAYQLIAGVRAPVAPNVQLGAKYRFFRTQQLDYADEGASLGGRFSSHSLLGSLIFSFGAPAAAAPYVAPVEAAPPPPPPPPATQTCPDGSVIMATDICPAPPPPPPPPPPGERG